MRFSFAVYTGETSRFLAEGFQELELASATGVQIDDLSKLGLNPLNSGMLTLFF